MPPLNPLECFPFSHEPSPNRDLTVLPATVDRGFFYVKDAIAESCDAGSTPTQGFRPSSKSVKDCRLSSRSKVTMRSVTPAGITGGYVEDAHDDRDIRWGTDDRKAHRSMVRTIEREGRRTGKNARKRAKRAR